MECAQRVLAFLVVIDVMQRPASALLLDGAAQSPDQSSSDVMHLVVMLESRVLNLEEKLREMESKCSACSATAPNDTKPAFMATIIQSVTDCFEGQGLLFDNVLLNDGSGYDPRHGTFTALRSGVYHFGVTLGVLPKGSLHVKLVRNSDDNEIGYLFADMNDGWNEVSTSLLVRLNVGDSVWLKCNYNSNTTIAGGNTYHSHFSGFLVN